MTNTTPISFLVDSRVAEEALALREKVNAKLKIAILAAIGSALLLLPAMMNLLVFYQSGKHGYVTFALSLFAVGVGGALSSLAFFLRYPSIARKAINRKIDAIKRKIDNEPAEKWLFGEIMQVEKNAPGTLDATSLAALSGKISRREEELADGAEYFVITVADAVKLDASIAAVRQEQERESERGDPAVSTEQAFVAMFPPSCP